MADPIPSPIPLTAIPIAVSSFMVGFKYAVQFGDGPIYVSPAMYDLIRHATGDELKTLLEHLPVKQLPPLPKLSDLAAMPMVTRPPEPDPFKFDLKAFLRRSFGG